MNDSHQQYGQYLQVCDLNEATVSHALDTLRNEASHIFQELGLKDVTLTYFKGRDDRASQERGKDVYFVGYKTGKCQKDDRFSFKTEKVNTK